MGIDEGRQRDHLALMKELDDKVTKVRTKSLDVSFNEILDMQASSELIIDPDYQRAFRWSEARQSRFIESLLLELPIPPIFVIEKDDGIYELIDGLQRVSSYLHFRGAHPLDQGFLRLDGCDIVDGLNGRTYSELPTTLQIRLKRSYVRMEVLRRESSGQLKYHMFKRLNTGGESLSNQEIRNCTMRLLSPEFNQFLIDMSKDANFRSCIGGISEEQEEQKYDQELVLRFIALKNYRAKYKHEVRDFLDDYMERVSNPADGEALDWGTETPLFRDTFRVIWSILDELAFAALGPTGSRTGRFAVYHFEAFSLGIQPHIEAMRRLSPGQLSALRPGFVAIKSDEGFRRITTGGGKNYGPQLAERISFVERRVGELL